jgi:hypothetical protein
MRSGPVLHCPRTARLRAAAAVGGGASSLLRLSAATPRLPSAAALDAWIGRAARPLRDHDTA